MRNRILLAIVVIGIIVLLLWRFACQGEKPVQPVFPPEAGAAAPPPDAAPAPDTAPAFDAMAALPPVPIKAESLGHPHAESLDRPHRSKRGAQEPKGAKEPEEQLVEAVPEKHAPEAAPPPSPPPDAAPIAKKPDAESLESAPAAIARKKGTVVLRHHNGMSGSFHLVRVLDSLDGVPVFERTAPPGGSLDEPRDLESPAIAATLGQHQVTVRLEYTAASRGVFTYAEGYKFRINSSYTFTVNPDHQTEVTIKGFEKGNMNTPLADKPAVEFQSKAR